MNKAQQKRYDSLYHEHLSALKRQGKADSGSPYTESSPPLTNREGNAAI